MAERKQPDISRIFRKPGSFRGAGEVPAEREKPLVTDGMQSRRREIERKKREWRREQETLQEDAREGWTRVWKTVGVVLLVIGLGYVYWRIQSVYHNRWPLSYVWLALAGTLVCGITWLLWYFNKKDM